MGVSASSLLDEAKSSYIKGQAEEQLKEFSPYYTKQFSVAWFSQLEDELVQNKEKITQLLQQKVPPEDGEVLYEESVLYFDDTRKWRERYVVVRANYRLECHDSLETFVKGVPPFHTLLPTGGTVVTTEEAYMAMVDKCFPGDSSVKEDFAPPQSGMPGEFPVFLRLPYRRDSYFCFRQEAKQAAFISILSDCIRHQNQDFLKKKTCEVQAFRKAIQLYRQDKDKYESWDMLIGSDVRVMANLVMEELLPSLGNDMLPRLKAKKTEKKRVWFATMEEAYILIQESLLEGLLALKEECRTSVRQQEVLIHSDMDQILNTRRQLEEKIRAKVSEPAERLCSESVQPYLGSVLEEMMEPISSGFLEGRQQSETMMDQVCQDILQGVERDKLNKTLADMAKPNLLSCYQKINLLQDKLHHLQERFSFSNITSVIHSAQIDLQQLMENAAYTFEQLLYKAIEDNPENIGSVFEKVKHRVLKQFDYDSSTMRKRIFQDTLVSVTLPFIKKNLAPTCKTELQGLEQTIYADYSNFIHVENVYENILLDILDKEVSRVVKEAASLNKHNLFADSSRSSLSSSSVSTPNSPALTVTSPRKTTIEALPPSPLVRNGLPPSLQTEQEEEEGEVFLQSEASSDLPARETPLGRVEQKEEAPRVAELPATKAEEVQTVKEEAGSSDQLETKGSAETNLLSEKDEVSSVQTEGTQTAAEPRIQRADDLQEAKITLSQTPPTDVERLKSEAPDPSAEPVKLPAEEPQPPTSSEETLQNEKSEVKLEAPSSGEEADAIRLKQEESESVTASYPNSLDVSVGSESPPSDLESTGDVSNISDVLEVVQTPESPEETAEDKATSEEPETSEEPSAEVQTEAGSARNEVEAGASMNVETSAEPQDTTSSSSPPSPDTRPPDCVKEIRDLVVEVIEVEEMLQHYPKEG